MKLTLVIPCYNEEENIDKMYAAIEEAFLGKGMDLELVYVNDGSRDNTLQKLRALLSKTDFQIKIVDFSRNFGKEAAIYAGLKQSTGDYTALVDGDLQKGEIQCRFSTTSHSGVMVPVYAFGPGSENFTGMYENSDIFHKIVKLLNLNK